MHVVKAFDKMQHLFTVKIISKLEIVGNLSNQMKCTYEKSTANVILNDKKKCFHQKLRKKGKNAHLDKFSLVLSLG